MTRPPDPAVVDELAAATRRVTRELRRLQAIETAARRIVVSADAAGRQGWASVDAAPGLDPTSYAVVGGRLVDELRAVLDR